MTIKNLLSTKSLILFISLCWAEVLIFTTALFSSLWIGDLANLIIKKLMGDHYYMLSPHLRLSPKVFFLFCFLGAIQFLFSDFLNRKGKRSMYFFLYLADACAISIFFINRIIEKTELRDYNFLWVGVLVVMLVSSLHLLINKNEKNYSHTPLRR